MTGFLTFQAADVEALLDYDGCIGAVREAMAALSASSEPQPLRTIQTLGPGKMFGLMPGALPGGEGRFGAKLVSVFADPEQPGRAAHRGVVVLFEGDEGNVLAVADAGSITRIRTGCASAVATDALARPEARSLAVFGTGAQAEAHILAISRVRPLERIVLWGRSQERAEALAERLSPAVGLVIEATTDGWAAAGAADIICTVSGAEKPILFGEWVRPGTHVNVVGSSYLGPVEVDTELVVASRYFADYRPSVLAAASEFAEARASGRVDEGHIAGEIGEVLLGRKAGRQAADQITLYKSLGHVVQDLAAATYIYTRAAERRTK